MIQIGFCDDDLSILSELRMLLDRYRVERNVEIASAAFQSPLELLTEIERGTRFDILLLDVMMPGENGIDTAREIRRYDQSMKLFSLPPRRNSPWSPTPWGPISTSSSPSGRRVFSACWTP